MKKFDLISFATAEELASQAAGAWLDEIESARRTNKPHCVALSGGRITHKLFTSVVNLVREGRRVGDPNFRDGGTPSLPSNVHFFWADERCVPPDDPESNFKLADELLFAPLKIPANQIHRIRGEDSPAVAVKSAEAELCRIVPLNAAGRPVLDLVFLGMGEDGHVASLFPNAPAEVVNHPGPFLFIENSPKPPPRRISLSYAAIAAVRQAWVLISGAGKEKALRESLDLSSKMPLAKVIGLRQKTLIFRQIEADKII
jgi:6-phosphogluconolactonase